MKKAKALHPVPRPKPKPKKHHGPRHAAPPHSTGSASHLTAPPPAPPHSTGGASHVGRILPGKPHRRAKPKKVKPRRPVRKLSPGLEFACCSAEALAMSLRLATDSGVPVTDSDVLALYFATADGPDDGASIEDALDAAGQFGIGGVRLVDYEPLVVTGAASVRRRPLSALGRAVEWHGQLGLALAADQDVEDTGHGLILGLDLPEGPHAVLATDGGWWSWGELYDPAQFPGAVIEEAWAVTWCRP